MNFCQVNAATLSSLGISSIAGLQAALDAKVDVVTGKALSENDFTSHSFCLKTSRFTLSMLNFYPKISLILNIPALFS